MFTNVFSLICYNSSLKKNLLTYLDNKISQDISEFNIPVLPPALKINIEFLSYENYFKKRASSNIPNSTYHFCIAYSDSSIYCVDYNSLPQSMPFEKYLKSIRHECIHILQHLATRIAPQSAVWLYESIACARAEQKTTTPTKIPSWDNFVTKFYEQPDCYALAYTFGTNLLNHTSLNMLAKQCENFDFFTKECEKIYSKIFNK